MSGRKRQALETRPTVLICIILAAFLSFVFYGATSEDPPLNALNSLAKVGQNATWSDTDCTDLIGEHQRLLVSAYAQSTQGRTHAVLLGGPFHENKGDSLIWLGEKILLANLGFEVAYSSNRDSHDDNELDRAIKTYPNLVIFFHGGGNLGNLYWHQTAFRLRIAEMYPNVPIRYFPQSIHFSPGSEDQIKEVGQSMVTHPDTILYIRDHPSQDFVTRYWKPMGVRTELVPDIAFMIGPRRDLRLQFPPDHDLLLFNREDIEAESHTTDWFNEIQSTWGKHLSITKGDWSKNMWPDERYPSELPFDRIVYERMLLAAKFINSGRFAIVDRLHGHIWSILLGVPHVMLDNNIGKISAYHNTWTYKCGTGRLAKDTQEAEALAKAFYQL